jgi:hypothetical protein
MKEVKRPANTTTDKPNQKKNKDRNPFYKMVLNIKEELEKEIGQGT